MFFIFLFILGTANAQYTKFPCEDKIYQADFKKEIDTKTENIAWKDYKKTAKNDYDILKDLIKCSVKKVKDCDEKYSTILCFTDALGLNLKIDAWLKDFNDQFPSKKEDLDKKYTIEKDEKYTPLLLKGEIEKFLLSNKILILGLPAYYDDKTHATSKSIEIAEEIMSSDFSGITLKGKNNYIDTISLIKKDRSLNFYKEIGEIDEKTVEDLRKNETYQKILKTYKEQIIEVKIPAIDPSSISNTNANKRDNTLGSSINANNEVQELQNKLKEQEGKLKKQEEELADAKKPTASPSSSSGGGSSGGLSLGSSSSNSRRAWERDRKKKERENALRRVKYKGKRLARLNSVKRPKVPSRKTFRRPYSRYRPSRGSYTPKKTKTPKRETYVRNQKEENPFEKHQYDYNKGDEYVDTYKANAFSAIDRKAALASLKRNKEYLARNVNLFDIQHLLLDYMYRDLGTISDTVIKYIN